MAGILLGAFGLCILFLTENGPHKIIGFGALVVGFVLTCMGV